MCVTLLMLLCHRKIIIYIRLHTKLSLKIKLPNLQRALFCSIAILIIVYYLIFRWRLGIESVIENNYLDSKWLNDAGLNQNEYPLKNNRNQAVSVVFLLDWCSLLALLCPLLIIFDRKKILWKPIGSVAIYAAILTIIAAYLKLDGIWSFEYFFLGNQQIWGEDAPLTFMLHYWMLVIGMLFLIYSPKVNKKDVVILICFVFSYIIYVLIMQNFLDCYSHTSALGKGDYFDYFGFFKWANLNQVPAYDSLAKIINNNENIWWVGPIILYTFSALGLSIIMPIKNYFLLIFNSKYILCFFRYQIEFENSNLDFRRKLKWFK